MLQSKGTGVGQPKRRAPRVSQLERVKDRSHQAGPVVMRAEKHVADFVREHASERPRYVPLTHDPDG